MTLRKTIANIRIDLNRYSYRLKRPKLAIILLSPGFQAGAWYRIRHWLASDQKLRNPLWWIVVVFELLMTRFIEIISGMELHPKAEIGPGLYMPHMGGIVVGEAVKVGCYCDIYHGVTLGYGGMDPYGGYPTIGDRVFIGAGAKVLGKITIGNDVIVGANAVVIQDASDRAILGGIPAQVMSEKGSFLYIIYPGQEDDPERQRSLTLVGETTR